jgi:hypothetical protein
MVRVLYWITFFIHAGQSARRFQQGDEGRSRTRHTSQAQDIACPGEKIAFTFFIEGE